MTLTIFDNNYLKAIANKNIDLYTFVVEGKEVIFPKVLLVIHSEYFTKKANKWLSKEDSRSEKFVIEDLKHSTVELIARLLRFPHFYFKEITSVETAVEIIMFSDRFKINHLKTMAQSYLERRKIIPKDVYRLIRLNTYNAMADKRVKTLILAVNGREVPAPKQLLIVHSDYFNCMLNGDWIDSKMDRIDIIDFDYSTVISAMGYLRFPSKKISVKEAFELLRFGDLYQMKHVIVAASSYLESSKLTDHKVLDFFKNSERLNSLKLMKKALVYLLEHVKVIIDELEGYDQLSLHQIKIIAEVYSALKLDPKKCVCKAVENRINMLHQ